MSYRLETNPEYTVFHPVLLNIQSLFSQNDATIHLARNELKVITLEGIDTVVKAFRIPNLLNRFVYAYLRKSKAYKAFHNANILHERGVPTPRAIGYIEFFRSGLLRESYFIAEKFDYDFTMAHIRDDQPPCKREVLEAFAAFTYDIHTKGIWHVDYSGGNILIKKEGDGYAFSLVDINRMKFRAVEGYEGLKNFNKLWLNEEDLKTIAPVYAEQAGLDPVKATEAILYHDRRLKAKINFKKRLKGQKVD